MWLSRAIPTRRRHCRWAADRATGHGWFNRVLQTLASIHDPEMLELCGVTAVADVLPGAELAGQEVVSTGSAEPDGLVGLSACVGQHPHME